MTTNYWIKEDRSYKCLFKTDILEIGHIYEDTYLINLETDQYLSVGRFKGDPECAFIDAKNKWCLIGGNRLVLLRVDKPWEEFEINEIRYSTSLRCIDGNIIQILTDPWSEDSAIWQLDIETKECTKIKSFNKYKDQVYTNEIDW